MGKYFKTSDGNYFKTSDLNYFLTSDASPEFTGFDYPLTVDVTTRHFTADVALRNFSVVIDQ
jgi:hypothetical protein